MNTATSQEPSDQQDGLDMARLAGGHDAALNDLMDRHGQRLFHYLVRQMQNETDAAEVAQETFVRIYQNRAKFRADAKFSRWLYTIATNLVRDRFRSHARHPNVSLEAENPLTGGSLADNLPEDEASPIELLQGEERAATVRQALAQLPEELRIPLILAEYEDQSQMEIAHILGCSPKAVETRIYRARQKLRSLLAGMLTEI
jgi:RNA polymerase sigma-70 factor (ECF subfamily)